MTKTIGTMRKIGLATAISGLVLGMSSATAADFDVTAEVQNTLEVTVVQPMSWGTLFATTANGDAIAGLTMAPNGDISSAADVTIDDSTGDAPSFLTLGGAAPAIGSVASNNNNFTLTVPSFDTGGLDDNGWTGDGVELRIQGGDPDVARFYMVDFAVGEPVGATIDDTGAPVYDFDPNFGVEVVEFGIGATIYTDGSGTRTTYEQGTYEGTFTVTASY